MSTPFRDLLWSAALAAVIVAVGVAGGLHFHLEHQRVARAQQRLLVAAANQVSAVSLIAGSADHRVIGYADLSPGGEQACAAEASVLLRTSRSAEEVQAALALAALPHIVVDHMARGTLRVQIHQPFGQNLLDWSCWQ